MFTQIISHTPTWVWILLAALLALGYSQTKARRVSFKRLVILPMVMVAMSANSMIQSFGVYSIALLVWVVVLAVLSARIAGSTSISSKVRYEVDSDQFFVHGSYLPMFFIIAIFIGKYGVAVISRVAPQALESNMYGVICATYFAALSAYFLGRTIAYTKLRQSSVSNAKLATAL